MVLQFLSLNVSIRTATVLYTATISPRNLASRIQGQPEFSITQHQRSDIGFIRLPLSGLQIIKCGGEDLTFK